MYNNLSISLLTFLLDKKPDEDKNEENQLAAHSQKSNYYWRHNRIDKVIEFCSGWVLDRNMILEMYEQLSTLNQKTDKEMYKYNFEANWMRVLGFGVKL
jgi:hypothetical protein